MSEGAFITTEAVDRIVAAGGEEAIAALASLRDATLAARRANEDAFGAALHVRSALHHLAAVIGDDESARVALAEVVGLNGDAIEERWFDTAFAGGSALRRENIARLRAMPYEEYLASPEWQARRDAWSAPALDNHTPWQEIMRRDVGDFASGACLEFATRYRRTSEVMERDNH